MCLALDNGSCEEKGYVCRKFLPPSLVDAFIGAIGEIGQLAVLYPLDTIKVSLYAL